MKKFLVLCMMLVLAAGVLAGCGNDAAKKDEGGKIVVGLDDNFPPMGFKDENNEIVGFDIDLAKEAELQSGRVDVLWNGLDITEKRKENMLFSEPYMDNRQIIFVVKGNPAGIKDEATLAGKTVGTQSGSTTEEYLDKNAAFKASLKEAKMYPDFINAFMDLENGRIDAVVGDEIVGRYYISKHPDRLEAVDVPVGPISTFGIAFKKDNQKLRDEVQKVIDEMVKDGTASKVSEKWFAADIIKK